MEQHYIVAEFEFIEVEAVGSRLNEVVQGQNIDRDAQCHLKLQAFVCKRNKKR